MNTIKTIAGECECGAEVRREMPENPDRFTAHLATLPFVCPACCERYEREDADREAQRDRAASERALQARHAACQIPDRLRGITWPQIDRFGREDAIAAAARWAAGELDALVLTGPIGVGKTWIAAASAWTRLERGKLVWFSAPVLLARLSAGFDSQLRHQALEVLTGHTCLVLDDLDKTRPTEYGAEALFCAIDERIAKGVPILATANLGLGEIAGRYPEPYGEAIASRLAAGTIIPVAGRDRRVDA